MKKFILITLCIITLFAMMSLVSDAENTANENTEIEFIFPNDSKLTEEQKTTIINYITNHENQNESRNIICSIFGHNYATEYIDAIRHKVFTTRPRCVEETYETLICKRCGYTEATLIGYALRDCCPED